MRVLLIIFSCFYFLACKQYSEPKTNSLHNGRYMVHLKDSALEQTIREYIQTFHLHRDSVIVNLRETTCWENHELTFELDYNHFEDFIISLGELPAYYTFVDSTLVTIYNSSFFYTDSSSIEGELRSLVKHRNLHLKKWNQEMYDPPLWTIRITSDSVTVIRRNRR